MGYFGNFFEEKLGQLLNIVQDIQSKLSIQDQQNLKQNISNLNIRI